MAMLTFDEAKGMSPADDLSLIEAAQALAVGLRINVNDHEGRRKLLEALSQDAFAARGHMMGTWRGDERLPAFFWQEVIPIDAPLRPGSTHVFWPENRAVHLLAHMTDPRAAGDEFDNLTISRAAIEQYCKKMRPRGRPPAPYWKHVDKKIYGWLVDNGIPERGDGKRAELEKLAQQWADERTDKPPGRSTVQDHVQNEIDRRRAELGSRK